MMELWRWRRLYLTGLALSCVLYLFFLLALEAHAQDGDLLDHPVSNPAEAQASLGSSPFDAPEATDITFVVDESPGLDTGCTFREEGPLVFEIEVDRFIGDVDVLRANGLLGEMATLRMPVFDVDYDTSGVDPDTGIFVYPERDRIRFNDKILPGEFLQGQHNTWIPNNFTVPIDWVEFPDAPGENGTLTPAKNVIEIDIDTANSEIEAWCTAVDWAALTIEVPPPILTVHGIFSSEETWEKDDFNWAQQVNALGLPYASISMHQGFTLGLDSIQNNAGDLAERVAELQARWGVDRINIVAHSKGGLDSRHFAEANDSVANLVQLGTPNGGSPLADEIQKGAVRLLTETLPGTVIYIGSLLAAPAGVQLTTGYMSQYNAMHGANPDTEYISLAGDYRFVLLDDLDANLEEFYNGPSDLVVPVWSVHSLSYAVPINHSTSLLDFSAIHTNLTASPAIYDKVSPLIKMPEQSASTALAADVAVAPGMSGEVPQSFTFADTLEQDEVQEHELLVDPSDSLFVMLNHSTGDLDLTLISPSGVRIDPLAAENDENVGFAELDGETGLLFEYYSVKTPETGTWTLEVTGATVDNSANQETYVLSASFIGSSISLTSSLDETAHHRTDPIIIEAALTDGNAALTGADVQADIAYPDESLASVPLVDDGTGADTAANDGVYSGIFTDTAQSGMYRILVNASKASSPAFNRDELLLAFVSQSQSTFNNRFDDFGNDTNGDGLFEELVIEVGLDTSLATTYRVYGELSDGEGNVITTASVESSLSSGNPTVNLVFDGEQIFQHAVDGPYVLHVVRLAEEDDFSVLPLDELTTPYVTGAYQFTQFQNAAIAIPGTGSDRGVDTNGNDLFDLLEINLNVFVQNGGTYQWSARLADQNGTELGVAVDSGRLRAGINTVTLQFDGNTIGQNGVDGPYFLSDLLVFSDVDSAAVFQAYTTQDYSFEQFERLIAPDLVVQNIIATEDNIQVIIRNQGSGPVLPEHDFWVDLYIDPDTPPTTVNDVWEFMGDEGLVWGVEAPAVPMQPGAIVTLSIDDGYYWPSLSNFSGSIPLDTPIYAQVDSANTESAYGGVVESHEQSGSAYNNIFGPVLSQKAVGGTQTLDHSLYLPLVTLPDGSVVAGGAAPALPDSPVPGEMLPIRP